MFNRLRKKPMTEEDTPVNKPSTARLNLFFRGICHIQYPYFQISLCAVCGGS